MTPEDKAVQSHGAVSYRKKGTGPDSAGQSGDTQGIDDPDELELLEEGQFYEAEVIESVEDAPDADAGGIRIRQVPEDDVPEEYLDQDEARDRD